MGLALTLNNFLNKYFWQILNISFMSFKRLYYIDYLPLNLPLKAYLQKSNIEKPTNIPATETDKLANNSKCNTLGLTKVRYIAQHKKIFPQNVVFI